MGSRWRLAWDLVQIGSGLAIAVIAIVTRERWAIVLVALGAVFGMLVNISFRWFWANLGWLRGSEKAPRHDPPQPVHEFLRWVLRRSH